MPLDKSALEPLQEATKALDQRARQLAAAPSTTLSDDEIRQLVKQFAEQLMESPPDSALDQEARYNPLLVVNQAITESDAFAGKSGLSMYHIAQLKLVEFLFGYLERERMMPSRAYHVLQLMQLAFARSLLRDSATLFDPDHPVRAHFEQLVRVCVESDGTSPGARSLLLQERAILLQAIASETSSRETFVRANIDLAEVLRVEAAHRSQAEERLITREQGTHRLHDIRHSVHKAITLATSKKPVPTFAIIFLHQQWSKYLYITYLRVGIESPQWHQGIDDMHRLVWSLVNRDSEELAAALKGDLGRTLNRMQKNVDLVHHSLDSDHFFDTLAKFHQQIIAGEPLNKTLFSGMEPTDPPTNGVPNEAEAEAENEAAAVPVPSTEVRIAEVGEWFRFDLKGDRSQVKLIYKSAKDGYLLFSDGSGMLGTQLSFDDFTDHFRSGAITPLDKRPLFEPALRHALKRLEQYIHSIDQYLTTREREAEEQRTQAKKAAEADRARTEEAARQQQIALQQQLEEETRRQEEEAAKQAEEAAEAARQAEMERLDQALAEVSALEPGGMVELLDEAGNAKICTLGLKLKRTGKLIFSDRTGRRIAELLPSELGASLVAGSARILEAGGTGDKRMDDLRWTRHTEQAAESER